MQAAQIDLFRSNASLPEGFKYQPELLSPAEEHDLVEVFTDLPFKEFDFHGYLGKRRVLSFGWKYDFSARELRQADDMPAYLLPLRERAAAFAGVAPPDLQQVLLTEYSPGAGIGWHRDKPVFGEVVCISHLSPCVFRLRRKHGDGWERRSILAEPGSADLPQGPARTAWEAAMPAVDHLRHSS